MKTKLITILSACLCMASLSAQKAEPDPHPDTLRVMTYNVWYAFKEGKAKAEGLEWVHSQTPDVVALQELTSIKPAELQAFATAWGHGHSALLKTSGFSVGLTSRWEIEVVEKGLEGMHHGYLHAKTNGVHYVVVHLSPFQWKVREREAGILVGKIKPLLEKKEKVIVLGDFNAFSPDDKKWLEDRKNAELLKSKKESDAMHSHVQNLKDGKFHYGVLDAFFKAGLVDTAKGHLPEKFETRPDQSYRRVGGQENGRQDRRTHRLHPCQPQHLSECQPLYHHNRGCRQQSFRPLPGDYRFPRTQRPQPIDLDKDQRRKKDQSHTPGLRGRVEA